VYSGPYEYSVPGAPTVLVMQTDPLKIKAHQSCMAIFTPTLAEETQSTGNNGAALPPGSSREHTLDYFDARLRRGRLGVFVGVSGIAMIFISFTSAYVVRQGLPTLDLRTGA